MSKSVNDTKNAGKTHYRKVFISPYLSSADITGPTVLTIQKVVVEVDRTKRTKNSFNTAYFEEKELRPGDILKPMILNAANSKTMKNLTNSSYIDDWTGVRVSIYVDPNVRYQSEVVEGLRISARRPEKRTLTPTHTKRWEDAKKAVLRDGNLDKVLAMVNISAEHQQELMGANNAAKMA